MRDPDLLILDEATNAVDGLSEAAIVETPEVESRPPHDHRHQPPSQHHLVLRRRGDPSGGRVKKQAPFGALASLSMDELYQHEPLD